LRTGGHGLAPSASDWSSHCCQNPPWPPPRHPFSPFHGSLACYREEAAIKFIAERLWEASAANARCPEVEA
jgi:hypothetical protein